METNKKNTPVASILLNMQHYIDTGAGLKFDKL